MHLKGIDDVENHTQEDDSHAEADGNDKYGIQFSDKGMVVILFTGRSHRAGMTSSNPKILPNIRPKNVEKTPAQLMIPARSICFSLYRSNPPIKAGVPVLHHRTWLRK